MSENAPMPWEQQRASQNSLPQASTQLPSWYFEIQQSAADYGVPEFPTLSQAKQSDGNPHQGPASDLTGEKRVPLRPREPGGKSSFPPPTAYAQPAAIAFPCPACLHTMAVPRDMLHHDFPCPACQTLVSPPRVAGRVAPVSDPGGVFRPDRSRAAVKFVSGEVRRDDRRGTPTK